MFIPFLRLWVFQLFVQERQMSDTEPTWGWIILREDGLQTPLIRLFHQQSLVSICSHIVCFREHREGRGVQQSTVYRCKMKWRTENIAHHTMTDKETQRENIWRDTKRYCCESEIKISFGGGRSCSPPTILLYVFPASRASGGQSLSTGIWLWSLIPLQWSDRKSRYSWPTFLYRVALCM